MSYFLLALGVLVALGGTAYAVYRLMIQDEAPQDRVSAKQNRSQSQDAALDAPMEGWDDVAPGDIADEARTIAGIALFTAAALLVSIVLVEMEHYAWAMLSSAATALSAWLGWDQVSNYLPAIQSARGALKLFCFVCFFLLLYWLRVYLSRHERYWGSRGFSV